MVSAVWKGIVSSISSNTAVAEVFEQNFKLIIGNWEMIQFWTDRWFNSRSLRNDFPRLFSLSIDKEGTLKCFYQRKGRDTDWKLEFRRPLLAWEEEEEVQRLALFLSEAPILNHTAEDSCSWLANSSGVFSVALVWQRMEVAKGPMLNISKVLWKNSASPKVQFFSWLAWRGRINSA